MAENFGLITPGWQKEKNILSTSAMHEQCLTDTMYNFILYYTTLINEYYNTITRFVNKIIIICFICFILKTSQLNWFCFWMSYVYVLQHPLSNTFGAGLSDAQYFQLGFEGQWDHNRAVYLQLFLVWVICEIFKIYLIIYLINLAVNWS